MPCIGVNIYRTKAYLVSVKRSMESLNTSGTGKNLSSFGKKKLGIVADDTEATKAIKTLALSTLITVAIFGNSLVIASVYKNINKRMRAANNYLVVSLSIADILLAIFSLSRLIILTYNGFEWPFDGVFGVISCKTHNFFIVHLLFVSTMNFMAMAIDRFVAVFFPFSAIMKGKLLYFVIAATWVFPGCFFAFYLKMMNIEVRLGITVCFANVLEVSPTLQAFFNFQIAQNIVVTGLTLGITVGLYAAIGVKLRQRRLPGNQQENNVAQSAVVARCVVRMIATVILVFCMCWSPTCILSSICTVNPKHKVCRNPDARFVKFVVAYSNSAITPFIYPLCSANFRESFKRILGDVFCGKRRRVSPQVSSVGTNNYQRETTETHPQRFPLQGSASN